MQLVSLIKEQQSKTVRQSGLPTDLSIPLRLLSINNFLTASSSLSLQSRYVVCVLPVELILVESGADKRVWKYFLTDRYGIYLFTVRRLVDPSSLLRDCVRARCPSCVEV